MTKRACFLVLHVALGAPVWCNAGAAFAQPNPSLSADAAKGVGASLSWWFRSGTRVLVSFDRTVFDGGAVDGDRETEAVVTSLLQLVL